MKRKLNEKSKNDSEITLPDWAVDELVKCLLIPGVEIEEPGYSLIDLVKRKI